MVGHHRSPPFTALGGNGGVDGGIPFRAGRRSRVSYVAGKGSGDGLPELGVLGHHRVAPAAIPPRILRIASSRSGGIARRREGGAHADTEMLLLIPAVRQGAEPAIDGGVHDFNGMDISGALML